MLLYVKDGSGVGRYQVVDGQEDATIEDRSSTIVAANVSQPLMVANPSSDSETGRSGWWLQNNTSGTLSINVLGAPAAAGAGLQVPAGQTAGTLPGVNVRVPLTTGQISVLGASLGAAFAALEW